MNIGRIVDDEENIVNMGNNKGGVSEAGAMIDVGLGLRGGPIEDDEEVETKSRWVVMD